VGVSISVVCRNQGGGGARGRGSPSGGARGRGSSSAGGCTASKPYEATNPLLLQTFLPWQLVSGFVSRRSRRFDRIWPDLFSQPKDWIGFRARRSWIERNDRRAREDIYTKLYKLSSGRTATAGTGSVLHEVTSKERFDLPVATSVI
jgi:hypothetical protein